MSRQIWSYILITFSLTWIYILSIYFLYKQNILTLPQLNFFYSFGAFGPFISAIISSFWFYRKEGVKKLFKMLDAKKMNTPSLLLSLSPLLLGMLGWLFYPLLSGKWYSFSITKQQFHLTDTFSYLGWALPLIAYGIFEEFGWRGFALPHLQEKYNAFKSTVILTFIWALWHAPFFFFRFQFSIGITIGFFIGIFVGAVILTAIFNMSKGSILACIIFHLLNNVVSAWDKQYIVATVSTGFAFLAMYMVWKYKPRNLSNKERTKNYFKTN